MANKKYTELPQANAITGAEILAMVQDGGSVQGDIDLIKAYLDTLYAPVATTITAPTAWTPTFTGFGTVSAVSARSWRVGSELFFEIVFTSGTATATEARISLGFNGTDGNVTSASTYPTLQHIGSGSSASAFGVYCILAEASKTYITIGFASGSSGGLSKQLANTISGSGWVISLKGSARIQGW
jgi:hypothetical protein